MAGPALQRTGTQILADAKYWAQDQGTTNPAVSTNDQLLRLNDRLVWWQNVVEVRAQTLPASSTGLSFAAGDITKVMTNNLGVVTILSAHQGTSSSLDYPLSKRIQRVSVEELYGMYDRQPGQSAQGSGDPITHWAAELDQTQQDRWRVFIYPSPTAARTLTVRCSIDNTLAVPSDTADLSPMADRCVARLVGYDMAGVQKQNDPAYLQWVLSGIPKPILDLALNNATRQGAQQARITDFGALSY